MRIAEIKPYMADTSITIVEAMKQLDQNAKGILFIVDERFRLLGSVTDGDIRRWIIRTGDLSSDASKFMFRKTKYLYRGDEKKAKKFMREACIKALPILDEEKRIVEIIFDSYKNSGTNTPSSAGLKRVPVIVMAGGKGTRLYPYTKILPKPLIPIGDIPILERIINRFQKYGVSEFYLTVNYKKEMIKSYFSDLQPEYQVHYVEEDKPLGTAGSIRLINRKFDIPFIVSNCDVLIDADYEDIMKQHQESGNMLTIVSSLKNIEIPYGVLYTKEQGIVTMMEEKPNISFWINTGMYILSPGTLDYIPKETSFHMTDLVNILLKSGKQVGIYPVSEDSFLDMGEFEEMHRMEEKLSLKSEL